MKYVLTIMFILLTTVLKAQSRVEVGADPIYFVCKMDTTYITDTISGVFFCDNKSLTGYKTVKYRKIIMNCHSNFFYDYTIIAKSYYDSYNRNLIIDSGCMFIVADKP